MQSSDSFQDICHIDFILVRIGGSKSRSILGVEFLFFKSHSKFPDFLCVLPVNNHSKMPGIFRLGCKVWEAEGEEEEGLGEEQKCEHNNDSIRTDSIFFIALH